jgi:hypothetical protein
MFIKKCLEEQEYAISVEKIGALSGVAIVLIHPQTGLIWTVKELSPKNPTRTVGEYSIPLETRKVDENVRGNIERAMAEIYDDIDIEGKDIRAVRNEQTVHVNGASLMTMDITFAGIQISCDCMCMFYTGDTFPPPYNNMEVAGYAWVRPEALVTADNTRPLAQLVVRELLRKNHLAKNREAFYSEPWRVQTVFSSEFAVRDAFNKGELKPDQIAKKTRIYV